MQPNADQLREIARRLERTTLRGTAVRATQWMLAASMFCGIFFALTTEAAANPQTVSSANHPPEWSNEYAEDRTARVGEDVAIQIGVNDADKDAITFDAKGLPEGMKLTLENNGGSRPVATLKWRPTADDVGAHELTITASDGQASITKTIKLVVEDNWQSYMLPGLQYSMYAPAARGDFGVFQGVSAEIVLASFIHRNENRGPSHGRIYLDMDLLKSSRVEGAAFDFSVGFDLSIERNPLRRFLLPYFGLKMGGLILKDAPKGGFAQITPLLGMYLYAHRNIFVNASVGYLLPLSGEPFDAMRGVRGTLGVDFSLW